MSNQSPKRKRNQQDNSDTNNNTMYQQSLISHASTTPASTTPMLSHAFSLVSSESAVPAHPLLRRTRPYTQHNKGAASAANKANEENGPIANIFNGQPRTNLRSSLKRAQKAAVRNARRVTFPGFNKLSPHATFVNSQASTPPINFSKNLNFPNLPNEKKGGRRKQSRRKRTQKRKQSRRRA
jgi:hypothetical protein